jgi:hypothetical protein
LEEFDMKFNWKPLIQTSIIISSLNGTASHSATLEISAVVSPSACATSGTIMDAGEDCRTTPSVWEAVIYEMGLCTAHPFGASKNGVTFDASTCTVTYTDTSPSAVDIVDSIGGTLALTGTSSMPGIGTYGYPYLVMGPSFTVAGSFTNSTTGDTYRSAASNTVSTSAASNVSSTDNLYDFNGTDANCASGYLGAVVTAGTMDGFVTDSSLVRSESTDVDGSNYCSNQDRLIAVMNLTTPFSVTTKTYSVQFNFLLTDFGVQFIDGAGNDSIPDEFASAPFSGYFTILNAD